MGSLYWSQLISARLTIRSRLGNRCAICNSTDPRGLAPHSIEDNHRLSDLDSIHFLKDGLPGQWELHCASCRKRKLRHGDDPARPY